MDCSMLGFPVLHYLPGFAQTHVHWIGDAIQPFHPLLPPILLPSVLLSIKRSSPVLRLFASGGQSIGASALAAVFPMNIQGWFPLGLTCLISLQSKGLLKSLLQHHSSKASIVRCLAFFMVQLSHLYMTSLYWNGVHPGWLDTENRVWAWRQVLCGALGAMPGVSQLFGRGWSMQGPIKQRWPALDSRLGETSGHRGSLGKEML